MRIVKFIGQQKMEDGLPAPDGKTTVAVKITDMLGEEVLVTLQA